MNTWLYLSIILLGLLGVITYYLITKSLSGEEKELTILGKILKILPFVLIVIAVFGILEQNKKKDRLMHENYKLLAEVMKELVHRNENLDLILSSFALDERSQASEPQEKKGFIAALVTEASTKKPLSDAVLKVKVISIVDSTVVDSGTYVTDYFGVAKIIVPVKYLRKRLAYLGLLENYKLAKGEQEISKLPDILEIELAPKEKK